MDEMLNPPLATVEIDPWAAYIAVSVVSTPAPPVRFPTRSGLITSIGADCFVSDNIPGATKNSAATRMNETIPSTIMINTSLTLVW